MRVHLIPNSHIDPVWLWDKHEGMDEVLNTFRSACQRLEERPALTFCGSSLQFYEWVLQNDEALFARIAGHVKAGRWEIVGGWWVEADTNHPLEISLFKQAELSRAFSRKYFGIDIDVAYLPDCFGHPASLPRILAETGFKYFLFCRPDTRERGDLPGNLFKWTYNGQSVLTYRPKNCYTQTPLENIDVYRGFLDVDPEFIKGPVNAHFFGVGDHGGGPTIKELTMWDQLIGEHPAGDIGYSTCSRFFADAAARCTIPEYAGHLQPHAIGCYSVVRKIKHGVRAAEQALATAGRALQLAGETEDKLVPLWKTVLFNQFHDILPGSCLGAAADHATAELGGALTGARTEAYVALKISRRTPPKVVEGEYRVFNTLPHDITVPVAFESSMYYRPKAAFRDSSGRDIEIQEVLQSVRACQRRWEFVDTIPARGFKAYHFDNSVEVKRPGFIDARYVPGEGIQNEFHAITTDGRLLTRNGKGEATPLTLGPTRFFVVADCSDTWGHGVTRYADVVDEFRPVLSRALTGPITSKLHQRFEYGHSRIEVTYSLYRGLPHIYVDMNVLWSEYRRILKLQWKFPGPTRYEEMMMEAPGGAVKGHGGGNELPMQRWACLPSEPVPVTVLQSGAFACDWMNGRFRVTLVRSSLYGMHTPAHEMDPDDPENQTDQGEHQFRFCLLPGMTFNAQAATRAADTFCEPLVTIRES